MAYITATFMVEAISVAHTKDDDEGRDRADFIFPASSYMTESLMEKANEKDLKNKESPYYIRKKLELG